VLAKERGIELTEKLIDEAEPLPSPLIRLARFENGKPEKFAICRDHLSRRTAHCASIRRADGRGVAPNMIYVRNGR